MIPGIDVSHYQKVIDWPWIKRTGVKFSFCKATEYPIGVTKLWTDDTLLANAQGCKDNGIFFGAYHFYRSHVPADVQANAFWQVIRDLKNDLPPVLDVEVTGEHGSKLATAVQLFCETLKNASGRTPIIYTSGGFWRGEVQITLPAPVYPKWAFACDYPLWCAQYTNGLLPSFIFPWASWKFWQYSSTGRNFGIGGGAMNVDLDWFNGTMDELKSL